MVSKNLTAQGLFKTYYYLIIRMNDVQKSDAVLIEALREKGYKATPQRIAVCRFALQSRDHPTAQRVYEEVKKVHPTISLATVYKTLQILEQLDMVQELDFCQAQARFDSYMKPHVNLVCLRCGNIRDFDDPTAREIVTRIAARAEFTLTGQRLDIYGICKTCHARTKKAV
jgi:Fur family peroxide stress response transcriptional regulator